MTKNSKSASTIRRRRNRPLLAEFLSNVRNIRKQQPFRSSAEPAPAADEEAVSFHEVVRSVAIEKLMASDKTIFLGLLVIRLVNSLLIQTWFVPDEFWQSVEVAHKMVFKYPLVLQCAFVCLGVWTLAGKLDCFFLHLYLSMCVWTLVRAIPFVLFLNVVS
jgi:hypothetical protein